MNRAETAEAAKVMQAWLDGEPIQHRPRTGPYWLALLEPSWSWGLCDYRIKPAPRIVSWTAETCPVGAVIRHKAGGDRCVILKALPDRIFMHGWTEHGVAMDAALCDWTMDDGSPCGTIEEGAE